MFIIVEFQIFLKNARNLRKLRFFFENYPNFPEERSHFGEMGGIHPLGSSPNMPMLLTKKLLHFLRKSVRSPPLNCRNFSKHISRFLQKIARKSWKDGRFFAKNCPNSFKRLIKILTKTLFQFSCWYDVQLNDDFSSDFARISSNFARIFSNFCRNLWGQMPPAPPRLVRLCV